MNGNEGAWLPRNLPILPSTIPRYGALPKILPFIDQHGVRLATFFRLDELLNANGVVHDVLPIDDWKLVFPYVDSLPIVGRLVLQLKNNVCLPIENECEIGAQSTPASGQHRKVTEHAMGKIAMQ